MFDVKEYLITLKEQENACLGMAASTSQLVHCIEFGEAAKGEMLEALYRLQGYQQAYNALMDHAWALWETR